MGGTASLLLRKEIQKFLPDLKSIGSMRSSNHFVGLLVVRNGQWKLQNLRAFFSNALSI